MRPAAFLLAALLAAPAYAQPASPGTTTASAFALSPEGARLMAEHREEMRRISREWGKRVRAEAPSRSLEVAAALEAEPFDPVRLARAIREQQSGWAELQRLREARELDIYRQLTPEDRGRLAARMREGALRQQRAQAAQSR